MKKTIAEKYSERQISLPKPITYTLIRSLFRLISFLYGTRYVYHFDKKEMRKKQVIVLSEHNSFDSYIYTLGGYPLHRLNFVVGYHHVFNRIINSVGFRLGIIPKRNFEVDLVALRHMVRIIKKGGSLCVFPEGTFSFNGANHAINPSTENFIKQLGVTVVLCKAYGTYCGRPIFKNISLPGYREVHYEVIFTPDDLKNMTTEQISAKLLDKFKYNELEWVQTTNYKYKLKDIKGLETFLYTCPKCNSQYTMKVEKKDMICEECQNRIHINSQYKPIPVGENSECKYTDLTKWYNDERKIVKKEIEDPNFSVSYECELYGIHQDKPRLKPNYVAGEGRITITRDKIIYDGTKDGATIRKEFDIKLVPCFKYDVKKQNILNYHNEYYAFRPKTEKQKTIKYMMIVEELHNLHDEVWAKAYNDAYGA